MKHGDHLFLGYLHNCGIDITEASKLYHSAMKHKPCPIVAFYASLYPTEYTAWLAATRLRGEKQ